VLLKYLYKVGLTPLNYLSKILLAISSNL